ncbi:T9SS type A sorting domain-containing protein [Paenimyroides viscosum]|nr:T9SS type A sorting domain-containing protein [Paenimyroides viscosum]
MKLKLFFFLLIPFFSISQVQIGKDMNGDVASESFGGTLALSDDGKVVAVKAARKTLSNPNNLQLTYVRVFRNVNGSWTQIGNDIDGERFGLVSLSANGSVLAIGLPNSSVNGTNSGQVQIYQLNTSNVWIKKGQDIDGLSTNDYNGIGVSLSADGNVIAIGANAAPLNKAGYARVFNYNAGVWSQVGQDIIGEAIGDRSGISVSLSENGNTVAIGADVNESNGNAGAGHIRVYRNESGTWVKLGQDIDGKAATELFGRNVSISADGNTVAGGAHMGILNGVRIGLARVYEYNLGSWKQVGQDIPVTPTYGEIKVSLSSNAKTIAIGANRHQPSGVVKIFRNISGNWLKVGNDIEGVKPGDQMGISVCLSSDGNTVAAGAVSNDDNGWDSGLVRVFDLTTASSNKFVLDSFNIYPNPTSDILNISLENNIVFEKAVLYNNLGQIVKETNHEVINVSELAKGIYFVEATTNQGKATKKVIIK